MDRGYVSLFYIRQDKSDDWFLASEYWLLASEAYARGLAPGGMAAAQIHLENGVKVGLNIFDSDMDYQISATDKSTFISSLSLSTETDAVSFIQEQQWVALFYNGAEAWANWRRTKRPVLIPAATATISKIISRLPLPESAFNNINAPANPRRIDDPVYFERL